MKEGLQRIDLQYVDYYDAGFDDHDKVKSEPFYIEFNYQGGDLKTDFVRPETLEAAKAFAANPSIKIISISGGKALDLSLQESQEEQKSLISKVLTKKVEPTPVKTVREVEVESVEVKSEKI